MIFYIVSYYILGLICLGGWELVAYDKVEDWALDLARRMGAGLGEKIALYILVITIAPVGMPVVVAIEFVKEVVSLIGRYKR